LEHSANPNEYGVEFISAVFQPPFHVKEMHHTRVVHFELPADNVERAKNFYQKAFGWDISQFPGMEYHMVNTAEVDQQTRQPKIPGGINGGMAKRNGDTNKNTVITIDTTDIDATLKNIERLGGKTVQKKQPVADMGFTAYFKDTEGNVIGLWQSARRM
jgi:predicted enzyme related to lactoylglutathione lyase